jgi:hypothetical protein
MDINTVTQGLNDICVETGVCPKTYSADSIAVSKALNEGYPEREAKIIYAAELINGNKKVIIGCYEDKCVTGCFMEDGKVLKPCCHTTNKFGGMELTNDYIDFLKAKGYRVKEIPVED